MAVKAAVLKFMPFRIGNLPFVVRLTGSLVTSEARGPSSTHIAYFRALEAMVGIIRDDEQFFYGERGSGAAVFVCRIHSTNHSTLGTTMIFIDP